MTRPPPTGGDGGHAAALGRHRAPPKPGRAQPPSAAILTTWRVDSQTRRGATAQSETHGAPSTAPRPHTGSPPRHDFRLLRTPEPGLAGRTLSSLARCRLRLGRVCLDDAGLVRSRRVRGVPTPPTGRPGPSRRSGRLGAREWSRCSCVWPSMAGAAGAERARALLG